MNDKNNRNFDEYMENEDAQEFEEQEYVEEQPSDLPYEEGSDDNERTNLMTLLDYLEDALVNARNFLKTNLKLVDAQMCLDVIQDIRASLPHAIQYSEQMLRERERVLRSAEQAAANTIASAEVRAKAMLEDAQTRAEREKSDAKTHADNIVKDAELRARSLVDQNSIKLEAQAQAAEIVNNAANDAQERREQANNYVDQLLHDAEEALAASYSDIRSARSALSQNRREG